MAKDNFDWLAPVLGFVGLLAGSLFFTSNSTPNNNNSLPPPPMNQKPSGCGCQAKKT